MKRLLLITITMLCLATLAQAEEITIRGSLKKTVEPGGWLVASGENKYLILNARNFQKESWFKESTQVEAVGETKEVMTTFMEGTPFEAKSMKPVQQQATATFGGVTKAIVALFSVLLCVSVSPR